MGKGEKMDNSENFKKNWPYSIMVVATGLTGFMLAASAQTEFVNLMNIIFAYILFIGFFITIGLIDLVRKPINEVRYSVGVYSLAVGLMTLILTFAHVNIVTSLISIAIIAIYYFIIRSRVLVYWIDMAEGKFGDNADTFALVVSITVPCLFFTFSVF